MRLYIIRHADPDYPNNTITESGHEEARALAYRMAKEGLDRIYCSPMGRAIDTARYTAELCRIEPIIEDWTCEITDCGIDTDWGKMAVFNAPGELIRGQDALPRHDNWHEIPHLDQARFRELYADLQRYSDEFLGRLGYQREGERYRCTRPNREAVALFCHHGFGVTWLAHLLAIPLPLAWAGFWIAPSSVTTILFEQRSDDWAVPRCVGLGDTSHLYAAGLPIRTAGFITENW